MIFRSHRTAEARYHRSWIVAVLVALSTGMVSCATGSQPIGPGQGAAESGQIEETACEVPIDVDSVGTIVVGQSTGSFTEPYVQWGIEQGCFAKYGLTVENIAGTSQAARVAGLLGGSIDIVSQVPRILVIAMANGELEPLVVSSHYEITEETLEEARNVREFSGTFLVEQVLVASPGSGIETLRDLDGARVGVINARGAEVVGLRRLAEEEGFNVETIQFVEIDYAEAYNALLRGDLDAASLTSSLALAALEEGSTFLGHTASHAYLAGSQFLWITTPNIYSQKSPAVDAFREGLWEVYRLLEQPKYRDAMVDYLVERYDLDEATRNLVPLPDFTPRQVTLDELQQWVPELIEWGDIDREIVFDSSILLPVP